MNPKAETVSDKSGYRRERIERLLYELRYEVMRGVMEREIDERIGFRFAVPSKIGSGWMVIGDFRTRPTHDYHGATLACAEPRVNAPEGPVSASIPNGDGNKS